MKRNEQVKKGEDRVPTGGSEALITQLYVHEKDHWVRLDKKQANGITTNLKRIGVKLGVKVEALVRDTWADGKPQHRVTAYVKVSDLDS